MRRIMLLCLAFPFVLACGPSGIVAIDNIRGRGPTEPDTTRDLNLGPLTIRIQMQGTVTAADDGSPIAGASVELMRCDPVSYTHCAFRAVARTTTDVHGHYSLSFALRCWDTVSLLITHPDFFNESVGLLDEPYITCTEELQTIDIQLVRKLF